MFQADQPADIREPLQTKKVEDLLWQKVFYTPISEFRKRLAAPKPGDVRGQELRQKVAPHSQLPFSAHLGAPCQAHTLDSRTSVTPLQAWEAFSLLRHVLM